MSPSAAGALLVPWLIAISDQTGKPFPRKHSLTGDVVTSEHLYIICPIHEQPGPAVGW